MLPLWLVKLQPAFSAYLTDCMVALLLNMKFEKRLSMQLRTSCVSARQGPLQNKSATPGGTSMFPLGFNLYASLHPV